MEAPVVIGINGFGRIGRCVARIIQTRTDMRIGHVNDPQLSCEYMAYLLKHDSVHRAAAFTVQADQDCLILGGRKVTTSAHRELHEINWKAHGVQVVVEASGVFKSKSTCKGHTDQGVKVVITSPPSDDAPTFVMGVNQNHYDPSMAVVSNASCTTNCLAPIVKLMDQHFEIIEGFLSTVHAMTANQLVVDGASKGGKDWRAGRAASSNIIPASTGAAKAVSLVYPAIQGKLTGMAFRVPTLDVSVVDFTVRTRIATSLDDIIAKFEEHANGALKGILGVERGDLVSEDFVGDSRSCIVDAKACMELNSNFFKIIAWYDNEYGYSHRVVDLAALISGIRA